MGLLPNDITEQLADLPLICQCGILSPLTSKGFVKYGEKHLDVWG